MEKTQNQDSTSNIKEREDLIEDLANHPLFMKEYDPSKENPMVEAIQNLIYEQDKEDLAKQFFDQGSAILKEKVINKPIDEKTKKYYLKNVLKKFNEALDQDPEDNQLKVKILSNRAFVNTELSMLKRELWKSSG